MSMSCFDCHDYMDGYNRGKKEGTIEELEKTKSEIEEIKMKKPLMSRGFECYGFKDKTPEDIKTEIIEMLDNRITELKGENKNDE